jgi:hypothetical protein
VRSLKADVAVIGGGLGGVAAALAALKLGRTVVLSEETDWLGGVLSAQAVVPDEHPWIEETGCSASYRHLRQEIRGYYRRNYPVAAPLPQGPDRFNPGAAPISRINFEPRVAAAVMDALLAGYQSSRRLTVLKRHRVRSVDMAGDRVRGVELVDLATSKAVAIDCAYVVDATELGDVLPLAGVEHVIGAESQASTGERHARSGPPEPRDQQSIAVSFAFDFIAGGNFVGDKPAMYDYWKTFTNNPWQGSQLSWDSWNHQLRRKRHKPLFLSPREDERGIDFWHYRRIAYAGNFTRGFYQSDIVVANWHQNDYWNLPLVGGPPEQRERAIHEARQLSLSLFHWMQTEAPRHDGGYGYPELRLREDVMDTEDGLAKHVYVRESRRIAAETTILEQHISKADRVNLGGAERYEDSVGIGYYNVDLHPCTVDHNFLHVGCLPFQLPLGALLPVRVENLLPGSKNIGTTHITNGAYRFQPVEWGVGEAAGALAAYCAAHGATPRQVRADRRKLRDFQTVLAESLGVPLAWPDYGALDRSLIANEYWLPQGMAPDDGTSGMEASPILRGWS